MSMNNENTFSYTYSAKENEEVQRIRDRYTQTSRTEMDELKELDAKVHRPANVFAYSFGSISAIIMGTGMSLVMTDIGADIGIADAMVTGVIVGIIGMLMVIANYPIYKRILGSRRKKYADEIMALSDNIMKA